MLKKLFLHHWPLIVICLVISLFFARLFFPPSLFINPDYGRSDFIHFNLPVRYVAAQSLKNLEIPFWISNMGQGFPLFDEGQIGFFYIPNIILFFSLPFWLAFNLGLVVTFFISALSTYYLARSFNLRQESSLLAALTYTFSPIFVLRLHHFNLIQTAALIPLMLLLTNLFFERRKIIYLALLPFIISQQIFAGFPQMVFMGLLATTVFFLFRLRSASIQLKKALMIISLFSATVLIGFSIASIQLAATANLNFQSNRTSSQSPTKLLISFPFYTKNLSTFFSPYILGDPTRGDYPLWVPDKWGIFWESNSYIGLSQLTILASLLFTILFFSNKIISGHKKFIIFFLIAGFVGILLALGKSAPLHPVFSIPPFSLFRVPSRFLLYTFLSFGLAVAFFLDNVIRKTKKNKYSKVFIGLILVISVFDIFHSWYNYHISVPAHEVFDKPKALDFIGTENRTIAARQIVTWNKKFMETGWQGDQEKIIFQNNYISQNSNLLYGANNVLSYAGMSPGRITVTEVLLNQYISDSGNIVKINPLGEQILKANAVKYLTSPFRVESNNWELITNITSSDDEVYVYKNKNPNPSAFAVTDYKITNSLDKTLGYMSDENFDSLKTVILEKEPNLKETSKKLSANIGSVNIESRDNKSVKLSTNLNEESIVVLSDTYYNLWKAKIDGSEVEVLPANINSRAVITPKGKHTIEYYLDLSIYKKFGLISAVSSLIYLGLIFTVKRFDRQLKVDIF